METERSKSVGLTIARLARLVERAISDLDLTLAQYRVLATLDEGHEAASVLATKLSVSRPTLTGVVDGLVSRGLVLRRGDSSDRRRVSLDLTDAGRLLLAEAESAIELRMPRIERTLAELATPSELSL